MSKRKTVFLPIELKKREFTSQVLLSSYLVDSGFRVFLGSHAAIRTYLRNRVDTGGIYLDKSVPITESLNISKSVDKVIVLDQELSPVIGSSTKDSRQLNYIERLLRDRIPTKHASLIDFFLTPNEPFTSIAKKLLSDSKVIEIGLPRFDLTTLDYRYIFNGQVRNLQKRFGNFALYISNFGFIGDVDMLGNSKHKDTLITESYTTEDYRKDREDFERSLESVLKWQSQSRMKLIIRPHPSEDERKLGKRIRGIEGVLLQSGGEIYPWILAASLIIHRGSTVSIQSILADKSTYFVEEGDSFDRFEIPKRLSSGVLKSSVLKEFPTQLVSSARLSFLSDLRNLGTATKNLSLFISSLECALNTKPKLMFRFSQYLSFHALRRALGLLRDEINFFLRKLDIPPQSKVLPGGIRKKEVRRVLIDINPKKSFRVRNAGINLVFVESK